MHASTAPAHRPSNPWPWIALSVVIVAAAAVAGLAVFWARAAADSLRSARRPRLVAGSIVALVVLAVVLIVLGIELPRE
jgi:hypothetical protein